VIKRIFKLIWYFAQYYYWKSIKKTDQFYQVLYRAVNEFGGIYVKLIQFLSLRTDFLPDEQKTIFLCFFDNVTPEPLKITDFLYQEIGDKVNQFQSVQSLPFASGTFGQVYKARLKDNTQVVLKVKRANTATKLKTDILIIKLLSKIFSLFYYQRLINISQLVNEFTNITLKELNYLDEVKNAQFFYNYYLNHPVIYIPKTYAELSTNNLIVQEYVGGIAMTDLIRLKLNRQDFKKYLKNNYQTDIYFIIRHLQHTIILEGLELNHFYSDPHPGNIKILPNNKYALIDFGIIAQPPGNRRAFYEIVSMLSTSIVNVDIQKLSQEFLKLGSTYLYRCLQVCDEYSQSDKPLSSAIINKYRDIVENHKEEFYKIEVTQTENFQKVFFDMFKMGEKFNMHLSPKIFSVIRASTIAKSIALVIDSEYHCMREIFGDIAKQVDGKKLINEEEVTHQSLPPETAVESLIDWMGSVAERDPSLFYKVNQTIN